MDYRLALMTGIDFPIDQCGLIIHQPTLKEISYVGEQDFFMGVQLLCINKAMYETPDLNLQEVSDFTIFMQLINEKNMKDKKENVKTALQILFPSYQILFTPRSILFNQEDISLIIDEGNFTSLQETLNAMLCLYQSGKQSFNPEGKKAKEIAQKLQKARERAAEMKKHEEGGEGSAFSQYLSVITVGIGSMSLQDAVNLTIYQLYDIVERYSLYVNWDLDVRSRLAGAKAERPLDNWMKSIH